MRRSLLLALVCLALLGPGRMRAQGVSPATQDSSSVGPDATTQPFKFNLTARDAPNDGGGYIDLEWTVFPPDSGTLETFSGYRIFRAVKREGPFDSVGYTRPSGPQDSALSITATYTDSIKDGKPFYYYVRAFGPAGFALSDTVGPAKSSAQWFHTRRLNFLLLAVLFGVLLILYIERAKKGKMFVRRIAGLDAIEDAVGRRPKWAGRFCSASG
jgi:hypothetical protein